MDSIVTTSRFDATGQGEAAMLMREDAIGSRTGGLQHAPRDTYDGFDRGFCLKAETEGVVEMFRTL